MLTHAIANTRNEDAEVNELIGDLKGYGKTVMINIEPDLTGGYAYQAVNNGTCFGFCTGTGNDPALLNAARCLARIVGSYSRCIEVPPVSRPPQRYLASYAGGEPGPRARDLCGLGARRPQPR